MEYSQSSEPELIDYLKVLTRHKLLIVAVVVLITLLAVGYSYYKTPTYTATADVLLSPLSGVGVQNQSSNQNLTPTFIETQVQLFNSAEVQNLVAAKLGEKPPLVSVTEVGVTAVIEISSTNIDPTQAARIANAYASSYVTLLQNQVKQAFAQSISGIQQEIDKVQSQITSLNQQISSANPRQQAALQAQLQPQINSDQQSLTVYGNELVDAQIQQQLTGEPAQIVSPAVVPLSPSSMSAKKEGIIGAVIGLLIGITIAFFVDRLDDTVKNKEEIERIARPLSVIGLIPFVDDWNDHKTHIALTLGQTSSPIAEAYRSLRTSIQFISLDKSVHVLQITSSKKDEGKTTTVANLGVALAEAGQRVVIVSCDLRLPKMHEYFNLSNKKGLTSVVLGEANLIESLQKVITSRGDLKLLASGPKPPNPSEILAGSKVSEIINDLKSMTDIILIDTPPVLPVTDAAVLSRIVDSTLVVGMANKITKKQFTRTLEILRQVNAPLIGILLNGVMPEAGYGGSYSYTYGYGYYDTSINGSIDGADSNSRKHRRRTKAKK